MVGSAICRRLERAGHSVVLPEKRVDLCNQQESLRLIETMKPDWIFLAAAKVGGINANDKYPAEFIYTNLMIQTNVLHAAYLSGVKKVTNIGKFLHLSKICASTYERKILAERISGTNQSGVCGGQNCRNYYGPII